MGRLAPAMQALSLAGRIRTQAQHSAGILWRDAVHQRLTHRNLEPLDVEERRFLVAIQEYDAAISRAINTLGS